MMADLYNKEAKVIGEIEVPDRLFNCPWNPDLVHQALRVQEANKRTVVAHAKGRGEVSGGGKKPWRQKGTGRARHGSTRSPIWVGGGVTHGPTAEKKFSLKLNQKMRQAAIFAILSLRLKKGEVKIVDSLSISEPKTKLLMKTLTHFLGDKPNVLLVLAAPDNLPRASYNLSAVKTLDPKSLNVYDLLRYKYVLLEKEVIPILEAHYHAVK
ncbi:MAG: 50S ribosomal protein L4 [Candidatus Colwellbacteria bacterium]|nr:50S ribosomal protein L4 [Candidatus Colwellbacteria bacterium]MBI3088690.1 50S ribosomal protein L4 [Candidatus Colwellbacteria bacterium]